MLLMLQTIIAASNNRQGNSLKQLLIVVAIVVVYGLKMLANARKSFAEDKEESRESPQPQQQGGQMPERKRLFKSIPVAVKKFEIATKPEPVIRKSPISQKPQPQERGGIALELDLDNTDSLRKAIIYSEILGKPVALRQDN